jgi:hypothetical protein
MASEDRSGDGSNAAAPQRRDDPGSKAAPVLAGLLVVTLLAVAGWTGIVLSCALLILGAVGRRGRLPKRFSSARTCTWLLVTGGFGLFGAIAAMPTPEEDRLRQQSAATPVEAAESTSQQPMEQPTQTAAPAPAAKPDSKPPNMRVLDEEISDSPIKTQVKLHLAVPRTVTRGELDALMRSLYATQMARSGFKARPTPNAVYAFIYLDGIDWKANSTSWVGRVSKAASSSEPTFDNKLSDGSIKDAIAEVLGTKEGIEVTPTEVSITRSLDDEEAASPREISKSMMFALFFTANALYQGVGRVDALVQVFTLDGRTIGTVRLTRAAYDASNYDSEMGKVMAVEREAMAALAAGKLSANRAHAKVDDAQRTAQRKILKNLGAQAVRIEAQFRP